MEVVAHHASLSQETSSKSVTKINQEMVPLIIAQLKYDLWKKSAY
jgi:hypothetical protein